MVKIVKTKNSSSMGGQVGKSKTTNSMGGQVPSSSMKLPTTGMNVLYSAPTDLYKPITVNQSTGATQTAALVHMNTMNSLSDRARRNMLGNINQNNVNKLVNQSRPGGIQNIN